MTHLFVSHSNKNLDIATKELAIGQVNDFLSDLKGMSDSEKITFLTDYLEVTLSKNILLKDRVTILEQLIEVRNDK